MFVVCTDTRLQQYRVIFKNVYYTVYHCSPVRIHACVSRFISRQNHTLFLIAYSQMYHNQRKYETVEKEPLLFNYFEL